MFGISEIALLLIVVIVVLAAKRLPDLVRSAGKATRILKSETRAMKDGVHPDDDGPPPRVIKARPGDVINSRTDEAPSRAADEGGARG
ncbi:twin-arginine translocase TatA/TatE family subunit [Streptomyces ochraceiscleroticus]|uniref:Twin-arginine translocase TatA/TatE family subunit n=1 Tax=Streptomyces ochraceiscleroticus TaxID=47761 RepID=A0ABW1MVM8_9ACTN|nr:twin-arginine translocase TatA/TatE family subunit [Streptomyces ochraceiscleroticus]